MATVVGARLRRGDVVAGISLAAFAVPESIAYATLAGLPPVSGLYCYLVGGIGYALFGRSRAVAVGPTSAIALLIGSSLAPLAGGDGARYALLAAATASLVGIVCIVGRFVRVGAVVNLVSNTVLVGFKTGAALYIAATQLPKLFGLATGGDNFFTRIGALVHGLPHAQLPATALGLGAVVVLLALAHRFPGRPTTIAVVVAILALMHTAFVSHLGIPTIGSIPDGLPRPGLPVLGLPREELAQLVPIALACFVLAYVETITTARTLAEMHDELVDPERELLGLGTANLAAGSFAGFPISGGMSQSAVNDLAGARSPAAVVVTSIAIGVVLLVLAAFFSVTPQPLLGAVVVVAALHLINLDDLRKIWRSSRHEFWVAVFAAVAVLATGLLEGVMCAVGFSLLMILVRASRPAIAILGELPGTTQYVNVAYNVNAVVRDEVLVVRVYGPWQYFNADFIRRRILQLVAARSVRPEVVVIDFSASPTLDLSSVEMLDTIGDELRARGIRLRLARLYDETANKLRRTRDVQETLDPHESVHDIVAGELGH